MNTTPGISVLLGLMGANKYRESEIYHNEKMKSLFFFKTNQDGLADIIILAHNQNEANLKLNQYLLFKIGFPKLPFWTLYKISPSIVEGVFQGVKDVV